MLRLLGSQDSGQDTQLLLFLELCCENGLVCGPVMRSMKWSNVLPKNYDGHVEHVEKVRY